ncbi:MAG: hypothetical protein RLN70_07790, partial [Rhodospirillaceae bacterium]
MSKGGKTTTQTVNVPAWWTRGVQGAIHSGNAAFKPYLGTPDGVKDGLAPAQQDALKFLQQNLFANSATPAINKAHADIGSAQGRLGGIAQDMQGISDNYLSQFANQPAHTLEKFSRRSSGSKAAPPPGSFQSTADQSAVVSTPSMLKVSAPTVEAQSIAARRGRDFMDSYKNPYTRDVVDASLADLQNAHQRNLAGSNMAAAAAGAFGGGRHGIRDAQVAEDYLRNVSSTAANLRNEGFNTTANLGMQDANRALSADTTNAANDLAARQFSASQALAAQQFNADLQNQRE